MGSLLGLSLKQIFLLSAASRRLKKKRSLSAQIEGRECEKDKVYDCIDAVMTGLQVATKEGDNTRNNIN